MITAAVWCLCRQFMLPTILTGIELDVCKCEEKRIKRQNSSLASEAFNLSGRPLYERHCCVLRRRLLTIVICLLYCYMVHACTHVCVHAHYPPACTIALALTSTSTPCAAQHIVKPIALINSESSGLHIGTVLMLLAL